MAAGETKATVTAGSTSYDYPDPDWSHFSGLGTAVMEDGVPNPVRKILTFASEPLAEDLEVIGSIVLNLWASSDQTDTDFFVRLTDQLPDGEQIPGMPPRGRMLTRGWLKASHACTKDEAKSLPYRPYYKHDAPKPIEPGTIYKFEIEVWATACCFPKGHRHQGGSGLLRLQRLRLRRPLLRAQGRAGHHLPRQGPPVAHRAAGDPAELATKT